MERITRDTLVAMSKDELVEAVESIQLKLEVAEKEKEELKGLAEIGKKYLEHLRLEAGKFIRLVEGENSALLKLVEKADVDTLKGLVDEYTEKARTKLQATSKQTPPEEETKLSRETLEKADYKTLMKLSETFRKQITL